MQRLGIRILPSQGELVLELRGWMPVQDGSAIGSRLVAGVPSCGDIKRSICRVTTKSHEGERMHEFMNAHLEKTCSGTGISPRTTISTDG